MICFMKKKMQEHKVLKELPEYFERKKYYTIVPSIDFPEIYVL